MKFSSKSKRFLIIVFDVLVGIMVEIWASDSFPQQKILWVVLFFVFLVIRLSIDFFVTTVEDKFFDLQMEILLHKFQSSLDIQKDTLKQMQKSIEEGNFEQYEKYLKIKNQS